MSVEHASTRIIDGYARGDTDLGADDVWALEAHLERCRGCRDRLSAAVTATAPEVTAVVGTVWSALEPRLATTATMPGRRRRWAWLARWLTPTTAPSASMIQPLTQCLRSMSVSSRYSPAAPSSGTRRAVAESCSCADWSLRDNVSPLRSPLRRALPALPWMRPSGSTCP